LFRNYNEVEQEFRNEIIINEQQKQMLIVLKSSAESKIEDLGLDSLFDYSLAKVSKPS